MGDPHAVPERLKSLEGLPRLAGYVFMSAGVVMVVGGIVLALDDPGGLALAGFGIVFVGAGWLARRVFATPPGKKAVAVSGLDVGIETFDGRRGRRQQASIIHVDENASPEEVEEARRAWYREQFAARADWVAGRIVVEDVRSRGLLMFAVWLWTAFTLAAAAAAYFWEPGIWFAAAGMAIVSGALAVAAARARLRLARFGASYLVPEQVPTLLGTRLRGRIETGVEPSAPLKHGFRLELSCIHRWEETDRRTGNSARRRTIRRREALWTSEAQTEARAAPGASGLIVPVDFALPGDQPPTTLGGSNEGILWQLSVTAAMPGIDYRASFVLPVLEAGMADLLAGGPPQ